MPWIPNEREIAAMLAADGKQRYEYFVHRVCDTGKIWSLRADGWAALGDDAGKKLFPLWPHEKYAECFKTEGFAQYLPEAIDLGAFIEEWLPNMKNAGVHPAVFPVPTGASIVVSCDDLQANLRHELSNC